VRPFEKCLQNRLLSVLPTGFPFFRNPALRDPCEIRLTSAAPQLASARRWPLRREGRRFDTRRRTNPIAAVDGDVFRDFTPEERAHPAAIFRTIEQNAAAAHAATKHALIVDG
jgi:hypothetical protein